MPSVKNIYELHDENFKEQAFGENDSVDWGRARDQLLVVRSEEKGKVLLNLSEERFNDLFKTGAQSYALRDNLVKLLGKDKEIAVNALVTRKIENNLAEWSFQKTLIDVNTAEKSFFTNSFMVLPDNRSTFTVFNSSEEALSIYQMKVSSAIYSDAKSRQVLFQGEMQNSLETPVIDVKRMRNYLINKGPDGLVEWFEEKNTHGFLEKDWVEIGGYYTDASPLVLSYVKTFIKEGKQYCQSLSELSPFIAKSKNTYVKKDGKEWLSEIKDNIIFFDRNNNALDLSSIPNDKIETPESVLRYLYPNKEIDIASLVQDEAVLSLMEVASQALQKTTASVFYDGETVIVSGENKSLQPTFIVKEEESQLTVKVYTPIIGFKELNINNQQNSIAIRMNKVGLFGDNPWVECPSAFQRSSNNPVKEAFKKGLTINEMLPGLTVENTTQKYKVLGVVETTCLPGGGLSEVVYDEGATTLLRIQPSPSISEENIYGEASTYLLEEDDRHVLYSEDKSIAIVFASREAVDFSGVSDFKSCLENKNNFLPYIKAGPNLEGTVERYIYTKENDLFVLKDVDLFSLSKLQPFKTFSFKEAIVATISAKKVKVKKDLIFLDKTHFVPQNKPGDSADWPRVREQMLVIKQGENGERIIESLSDEKFNDLFSNGVDDSGYNKSLPPFALRNGLISIFGKQNAAVIDKVVTMNHENQSSEWSFQGMSGDMMVLGMMPLLQEGLVPNNDSINFTVFELLEEGQLNIHKISFASTLGKIVTNEIIAFNGHKLIRAAGSAETPLYRKLSAAPELFGIDIEEMRKYLMSLGPQELVDLLSGYKALSEEKYNRLAEFCKGYHPLFITTGTVYSEGEQQMCRMLTHLSPTFEKECNNGLFNSVDEISPIKESVLLAGFVNVLSDVGAKVRSLVPSGAGAVSNKILGNIATLRKSFWREAPEVSDTSLDNVLDKQDTISEGFVIIDPPEKEALNDRDSTPSV